ncbi:MAG: hypothetical protein L3J76_00400 [Candidatus Hydrothermae bacterium]|nr:hypothetical protein [Candidatus Hydrothermae bacterium]
MAHAYTPGLKVAERTVIVKERRLPLKGEVRVQEGDRVRADEVVARTELPGNVVPVNMSGLLAVPPEAVPAVLKKQVGDTVENGEVLAASKGLFGFLFKPPVTSPVTGTVESISEVTGQVMLREPPIPVEILAYVNGRVARVISDEGVVMVTVGSFIQGIFGIGGEVLGTLDVVVDRPDVPLTEDRIPSDATGRILVGGSVVTARALRKAREAGAVGVVVGGIDSGELKAFMGRDIGVAITGNEEVGLTLMITEGFSEIPMASRTFALFQKLNGQAASMNGATQIRAGVIRPEVIVSDPDAEIPEVWDEEEIRVGRLEPGRMVRVIRAPYFGEIGTVVDVPAEPTQIETEARVRVVKLRLSGGEEVIVPRANVELIEEV